MGKADEIRKKFGANITESVSSSSGPAHAGGIPARREPTGEQKGASRTSDVLSIEVERIIPDPDQPRKEFDEGAIERMAASLAKHGQITPIAVRWSPSSDRYVIVAGERRWRGAMRAGIKSLDCKVRKGPVDSGDLLAVQLVENLLREDLSPMDQAHAFRRLMDANGWSGARLAQELSIAQPRVVQMLALLDLPDSVREKVELEELSASSAYELSKVADPVVQEHLADAAVKGQLTRSDIREEVARASATSGARNPGKGRGGKSSGRSRKKDATPKNWAIRTEGGFKITIEHRKPIDPTAGFAAIEEAATKFREKYGASA